MALVSAKVTIGDSATKIFDPSGDNQWVYLTNPTGGSSVFIGPSGVATDDGLEIESGSIPFRIDLNRKDALYGVVNSGTQAITALKSQAGD